MGSGVKNREVLTGDVLRELQGVLELGRYSYTSAQRGLRPHTHGTALEICLLAKGKQTYRLDGRIYRVKGGDQFVAFPREIHDTGGEPEGKGVLYWLILDIAPSRTGFLQLAPLAARLLVTALCRLPARHFRADPTARASLDRVFEALNGSDQLRTVRAANWLVTYLLKTVAAAASGELPAISKVIQAAQDRVAAAPDDEWITVPELAAHVGQSISYFKARFKAETGTPPAEFVTRRKIDRAQKLLEAPGATVTSVAYDLGFSSSQYFATVFRRYMMRAPSDLLGQ